MPNLYQVTFLASLFLTFISLVFLSHFLNSKLLAAGYDVSRLILLGLPDNPPPPQGRVLVFDYILDYIMSFNVPFFGSVDLLVLVSSPAFILTSIIVIATGIYSNLLHTGSYSFLFFSNLHPTALSRSY